MDTKRTRFALDIVTEFLPPSQKEIPKINGVYSDNKAKVIIVCGGVPGSPSKPDLLDFFSKQGYWVIQLKYRGTWESGGEFMKLSPEQDVVDTINGLDKKFKDVWTEEWYRIQPQKLYLIGSSFGGPAVILSSRNKKVDKVVCLSPEVDVTLESKAEPHDLFFKQIKEAFGEAYRISKKNWDKRKTGKFYNPMNHIEEIDGSKILIFHSKDDDIIDYRPVEEFAKLTGSKLKLYKRGGHLGLKFAVKQNYYHHIKEFLK